MRFLAAPRALCINVLVDHEAVGRISRNDQAVSIARKRQHDHVRMRESLIFVCQGEMVNRALHSSIEKYRLEASAIPLRVIGDVCFNDVFPVQVAVSLLAGL